jgi:hypothetical protein
VVASTRTLWDRILDSRHVAFWTLLGSIAAVVTLVIALVSGPDNEPAPSATGAPTSPTTANTDGLSGGGTEPSPTPSGSGSSGLDYSLNPNYGSFELSSGFSPDPWQLAVTSGGSVSASSAGCGGWATTAPDVELVWGGSSGLLRVFFEAASADQDTTLIINDPRGQWQCSDDAYGRNPAIDFTAASPGTYDIWVGSYSSSDRISGTLSISELSSMTPDTV